MRLAPIPRAEPHLLEAGPRDTTYYDLWQIVLALREIIDTGARLQLAAGRELVAYLETLPSCLGRVEKSRPRA